MDKQKKLPNHIAIIMDGNGRWANKEIKIESMGIIKQKRV